MKTTNLKTWLKEQGLTKLAAKEVRFNENGYPFLTFYNPEKGDKGAENLYFSKAASKKVQSSEWNWGLLADAVVAEATNKDGEQRLKISFSKMVDIDDLF